MENPDEISLDCYYGQLISVRNLEVEQFWKRNVFIFGIQGVIISFFIGSFCDLIVASKYIIILNICAVFGFLLALLCFLLINTDRLWLEYYENKIEKFEKEINNKKSKNSLKLWIFCDEERKDVKTKNGYVSTKKLCVGIGFLFVIFWSITIAYLILYF